MDPMYSHFSTSNVQKYNNNILLIYLHFVFTSHWNCFEDNTITQNDNLLCFRQKFESKKDFMIGKNVIWGNDKQPLSTVDGSWRKKSFGFAQNVLEKLAFG